MSDSTNEGAAAKSWKIKDGNAINSPDVIENKHVGYKGYSLKKPEKLKSLDKNQLPDYALAEVEKQRKSISGISRKDMRVFMSDNKDVIIYFIVETHDKVESFQSLDEKEREGFLNALIGDEVDGGEVIDSGLFKHMEKSGLYVDTIGTCADGGKNCFGRNIYILGNKNEVFRLHGLSIQDNAEKLSDSLNEIVKNLVIN
jgi:hypothetical protein